MKLHSHSLNGPWKQQMEKLHKGLQKQHSLCGAGGLCGTQYILIEAESSACKHGRAANLRLSHTKHSAPYFIMHYFQIIACCSWSRKIQTFYIHQHFPVQIKRNNLFALHIYTCTELEHKMISLYTHSHFNKTNSKWGNHSKH